jgi:hypothetical protein
LDQRAALNEAAAEGDSLFSELGAADSPPSLRVAQRYYVAMAYLA